MKRLIPFLLCTFTLPGISFAQLPPHMMGQTQPPSQHVPDGANPVDVPMTNPKKALTFELSGYEYVPTAKSLGQIGSDDAISQMLIEMIQNDAEQPMQRLRAVDMLGYYPRTEVVAFLNDLAHQQADMPTSTNQRLLDGMQHRAITSLGRAAKEDAVQLLEDLLLKDDIQLQISVITSLGKHGGVAGRQLIESFVAGPVDTLVKEQARTFLQ